MIGFAACEECQGEVTFELPAEDTKSRCSDCEATISLEHPNQETLKRCSICEERDFYRNAQINPNFGIFMVASCFLGFLAFVYFMPGMRGFLLGASVLLGGAVLDRILRMILPEVAVCYHCKTVYAHVPNIDEFDVHDQEKRAEIETGHSP